MENIKIDVYVTKDVYKKKITYVQGSSKPDIEFLFKDFTLNEEMEARVYIKKPSGKQVYVPAAISGNNVLVTSDKQMFIERGECDIYLEILKNNETLLIYAHPVTIKANDMYDCEYGCCGGSENLGGFYQEYVQKVKEAIEEHKTEIEVAAEKAEKAASIASEAVVKQPIIKNLTWWIWDSQKGEYVDTGEIAGVGMPKCVIDDIGNLYIANFSATEVDFRLDDIGNLYYGKKVV